MNSNRIEQLRNLCEYVHELHGLIHAELDESGFPGPEGTPMYAAFQTVSSLATQLNHIRDIAQAREAVDA